MKIKINTNTTPYSNNTIIKPTAPLWLIKNMGTATVIINDIFYLFGGDTVGVDALKLLVPVIEHLLEKGVKEKIEVINNTEFKVVFDDTFSTATKKFVLLETSIEIIP